MKTFFCDIDGVIYKNGKINQDVIHLIKNNDQLIFCTGRGYVRCLDVIENFLGEDSIIIIENGSKIVDRYGNKLYFKNISNNEKSIIKQLEPEKIEYIIFNPNDSKDYISYSNVPLEHVQRNYVSFNLFCEEMFNKKITQITVKFKEEVFKNEFLNLCEYYNINFTLSENYVIINSNGVNKKNAIIKCMDMLKIKKRDITIIGNDYNDLEMFDIDCKNKIAVVDEYTPNSLVEKATIATNFDKLINVINKCNKK